MHRQVLLGPPTRSWGGDVAAVKRENNKSCKPRLQAMAAYRTAARLFPGLAAPLAGLGTEYARLNNMPLAEHMFAAATR